MHTHAVYQNTHPQAMELLPGVLIGITAIIILYALHFQHRIFKQEMKKTHQWLAAKTDAHKHIMQVHPELEHEQMNDIIHSMKLVKVQAGHAVYEEGSTDVDAMYLVRHGSVDVSPQGYPAYTCHRGSFFGELELNRSDRADAVVVREGTARASLIEEKGIDVEEVELWKISRDIYRKELMKIMMNKRRKYAAFLKKGNVAGLFKDEDGVQISEIELCMVASALEPVEFKDGAVIMREGETTNDLFMVSGSLYGCAALHLQRFVYTRQHTCTAGTQCEPPQRCTRQRASFSSSKVRRAL